MVFLVQRGKDSLSFQAARIRVGTHSSCELVLDDPIVAGTHLTISLGARGVEVLASSTSTGTYLDGVEVEGKAQAEPGSEIVIGASRIQIASIEEGSGEVRLVLLERDFFHTAKKRGEFQSDADEWVRSETRFGRMIPLRWLNAVALLLVVGGGLLFATLQSPGQLAWASPGHLSDVHAELFALAARGDTGRYADRPEILAAAAKGCAACHESGRLDYISAEGCLVCHTDMREELFRGGVGYRHPFAVETAEQGECRQCHREHTGEPTPVVANSTDPGDCAHCHHEPDFQRSAVLASLAEARVPRALVAATRGYEGFQHGSHGAFECTECHTPLDFAGEPLSADVEGVFGLYSVPDGVGTCFRCHSGEGASARPELAQSARFFNADLSEADHNAIAFGEGGHSAAGSCASCHADALTGELKPMLSTDSTPGAFLVAAYAHAEQTHAGGRACVECHLKPVERTRPAVAARFDHALHVDPADGAAGCLSCHDNMVTAADRFDPDGWGEAQVQRACARCHGETPPSLERAAGARSSKGLTAFAHADHLGEGSALDCSACHIAGADEGAFRVERVLANVSCATCHFERGDQPRHVHVPSAGSCVNCHSTPSNAMGAPRAVEASSRYKGFRHGLTVHNAACAECHFDLSAGDRVLAEPEETAKNCAECHVGMRFHWARPMPEGH